MDMLGMFENLPDDIVLAIVEQVDADSALPLRQTNQRLKHMIDGCDVVWDRVDAKAFPSSKDSLNKEIMAAISQGKEKNNHKAASKDLVYSKRLIPSDGYNAVYADILKQISTELGPEETMELFLKLGKFWTAEGLADHMELSRAPWGVAHQVILDKLVDWLHNSLQSSSTLENVVVGTEANANVNTWVAKYTLMLKQETCSVLEDERSDLEYYEIATVRSALEFCKVFLFPFMADYASAEAELSAALKELDDAIGSLVQIHNSQSFVLWASDGESLDQLIQYIPSSHHWWNPLRNAPVAQEE
mmetsp:Transcript_10091/g.17275  ORF Transcript_10091/g.17275 Transcript_10091/m.17275 type:complete len:303 (-) Transcript_10091:66-974(-)|eukprot:CAMPEP_0184704110 /NCGR_PEP_ID=MMETSP0313-20130426/30162_1 /TAXON_ID=2792 /ORGANISM="Porphyridium aerugineum, Strain SAG 1380-2" /LENGTH=302 /DNA_ID=CAMNT_0027165077 /DNA_START=183 /DNA_END=1091 /DNA_ORIENTATION=-